MSDYESVVVKSKRGSKNPTSTASELEKKLYECHYHKNSKGDANLMRKELGLSTLIPKKRNCLDCELPFDSVSAAHRRCVVCTNARFYSKRDYEERSVRGYTNMGERTASNRKRLQGLFPETNNKKG